MASIIKNSLVVVALGSALFALAGCSLAGGGAASSPTASAPAPSEQSLAEACGILSTSLQDLNEQLQASASELQTDPSKAGALMDEVANQVDAALAEVTNEEVLAAGEKASGSLHEFASVIEAYVADPTMDVTTIMNTVTAVQEDMVAIGTTCQQ